jgi:hypothetical protein
MLTPASVQPPLLQQPYSPHISKCLFCQIFSSAHNANLLFLLIFITYFPRILNALFRNFLSCNLL